MKAGPLALLVVFLAASALACIGSGSDVDSRWEGPGCQPACVADDYDLPGHPICTTAGYTSCSDTSSQPVCPDGKTPTCDDGPPACQDGSKPTGCQ